MMARHKSRKIALQGLYQYDLTSNPIEEILSYKWYDKEISSSDKELSNKIINGVVKNWDVLDTIIKSYSAKRSFDQISIVNKCILRLSIYSLINLKDTPARIIINEALELTREFESEESVSFINGILDAVYKDELSKTDGD
ncbi:MAG: transcription antitermination factor NusB [Leptospiraceae bacterium]|nr:transcription antitermination factor NusB [Leptospiraceae bacterium]